MTDPWAERAGGVIPFFIDWGDTPHPGTCCLRRALFGRFAPSTPDAERVGECCRILGLDVDVAPGDEARLIATLDTPNGVVDLS